MRSKLIIIAEALDLGIPVIHNNYIYKKFDDEIKVGMIRTKACGMKEEIYIGSMGWNILDAMSKSISEGELITLGHILIQTKERLDKGSKIEEINFNHEDEHFKNMKGL